jgi:MoaA/NifB/PqqE/SkfB family radical SAM enzyme
MTVEQFDLLLKQIEKQPITEAKLMGMGEPFMHPHFNTITRRFRETFPKAFVISATNCQVALTTRFIDAVKYLDMCYLSIDGGKENYEDIRFGSSWDKLHKFLRTLASVKQEVNCVFPVNFTVTPQNVFDIDILLAIVDMYSLDGLRINFVQNWDEDKSVTGLLNGFTEEQLDHLRQYKQYFKGKTPWNYSDCFWVKKGLYVTVDGNVKVCCMNTSAKPLGNLFQQPLQLIHSSVPMRTIASGCASNHPTEHCKNCSYKELPKFLSQIL